MMGYFEMEVMDMGTLIGSGFLMVVIIAAVMLFLHFVPLGLWISAMAANVSVSIVTLVGMRMRRVPPQKIVLPRIVLRFRCPLNGRRPSIWLAVMCWRPCR